LKELKARKKEEGHRRAREIALQRKAEALAISPSPPSPASHNGHGSHNSAKALRFVKWILATYPHLPLSVLDVAAGSGEVAVRLGFCHKIPSFTVDIRGWEGLHLNTLRKKVIPKLPKKWQGKLRDMEDEELGVLAGPFMPLQLIERFDDLEQVECNPTLLAAVRSCSLLLGLHADASTEVVVEVAEKYNKAFVVVPCCVFPKLFEGRRWEGREVKSTEIFVEYLKGRDGRYRKEVRGGGP